MIRLKFVTLHIFNSLIISFQWFKIKPKSNFPKNICFKFSQKENRKTFNLVFKLLFDLDIVFTVVMW